LIKMFAPVEKDTHQKLVGLADNRKIPLYQLIQALLVWAGDKDAKSLIGLGVNLPVYASELKSESGQDGK